MKKKLAILGRGTAGCLSLGHFLKWTDWDIDMYYDPNVPQQTVGEGSQLGLPMSLFNNLEFQHTDLEAVDGTFKIGIAKSGWGDGHHFMHHFNPPTVAYHFNAVKLQEWILNKAKSTSRFRLIAQNVDYDTVDSDFVINCSGKPKDYDEFHHASAVPVNTVYVTQCFWDLPRFQHTLTLARPHGWVFGIPLRNRCSIGYMFNNTTSTLEQVQEDVKQVFEEYNLTPSNTTNCFSFNNYYRKQNYNGRVAHNGNASFFLEPIEATSISTMEKIARDALDHWNGSLSGISANARYITELSEIEIMMSLHYYAGSVWKTPFWEMAEERATAKIKEALANPAFVSIIKNSMDYTHGADSSELFGTWHASSYKQNLTHLNLYNKLINQNG